MLRVPVEQAMYRRIEHYAEHTGQSLAEVANKAVGWFMDTLGDVIIEEYDPVHGPETEEPVWKPGTVIAFPDASETAQ